jgi:periplasmic divalent cation tolerance protein
MTYEGEIKDIGAEFVSVYITTESEDVAVHISTALVRERLAACANVSTGTRSIYEWEGIIQLDNEVTLILKTTADKVEKLVERAKEIHSYDVPCITVSPIVGGNIEYLKWVASQTR